MKKVRPTFLVAEPEPLQSLSVRKLILETSKFNVITAHSTDEALELFHLFPNVCAVVLVSGEKMIDCEAVTRAVKRANPKTHVVGLTTASEHCPGTDKNLSRLSPDDLVNYLRDVFGDPRELESHS